MLFGIDSLYFWLAHRYQHRGGGDALVCAASGSRPAAAALVAATFGASIWMQLVILSCCPQSCCCPCVRCSAASSKAGRQATNTDRIIGQSAVVTEPIDNLAETGAVRARQGMDRARRTALLPAGARVTISKFGVKAIVQKPKPTEKRSKICRFHRTPDLDHSADPAHRVIASNMSLSSRRRAPTVIERLGTYCDTREHRPAFQGAAVRAHRAQGNAWRAGR